MDKPLSCRPSLEEISQHRDKLLLIRNPEIIGCAVRETGVTHHLDHVRSGDEQVLTGAEANSNLGRRNMNIFLLILQQRSDDCV